MLVDAVAKTHQSELAILVLSHVDVLADIAPLGADAFQHLDARLVGARRPQKSRRNVEPHLLPPSPQMRHQVVKAAPYLGRIGKQGR